MATDDTDPGADARATRNAAASTSPRRPCLEPAPRARRVRALRRPGGRHAVVARAVPRARPRRRAAAAARATAHGRRSSARRTTAPPSRSRAATARRASCCTSSRTGRSASTPDSRTTAARSPACCSTRPTSSAAPTAATCSAASYREHGVHVGAAPAARARRPPPLRMGRAAPPRRRAHVLAVVARRADGEVHELVTGTFEGYERGSSVAALSRRRDGGLTRGSRDQRRCGTVARCRLRAPGARSSPRSSPTSGSRSSKFAAFADHRLGLDARGVDPLRRRHRQPGPAVPRRQAQPQGARRPSTRSASAPSATSGRSSSRSCCSPSARCSRLSEGVEKLHQPARARVADLGVRRARRRDRARGAVVAHRAARGRSQSRDGRSWWRVHPHHQEPRAAGRAARGHRRARRPRSSRWSGSASPRSPATRAGTPSGSIGIGLLLGVIAVVLADRDEEPADRRGGRRPASTRSIRDAILDGPEVARIIHLRTHAPRPRRRAASRPSSSSRCDTMPALAHAIDTVEARVRASVADRAGSSTSSPTSTTPPVDEPVRRLR